MMHQHYCIMVLSHIQNIRFGTNPNLISLMHVNKTSLASLYLFVFNSTPSKAIKVSLPQSRNQWYPASTVYNANDGL